MTLHEQQREFRRTVILAEIERQGGNKARAARALGIEEKYIYRLIRNLGIVVPRTGQPAQ